MPRKDLVTIRRGTLAQWATAEAAGAVLLAGERGYITDLNLDVVGDGVTKVASLPGVGGNTYGGLAVTTATAASDAAQTLRIGALLPLPPVGTRSGYPGVLSNGTNTGSNSFVRHVLAPGVTEVRFAYVDSYQLGETAGTDTITVKAGAGLPDGTVLPVFFRGSRTVTIEPGGYVLSDPVQIPQPAYVVSRTNVAVTSGQKWPQAYPDQFGTGEGCEQGTSITDKTLTGTVSVGSGINMFAPIAVIGRVAGGAWTAQRGVGFVGDSIGTGQGDSTFTTGRGLLERAVGNSFGFINACVSSETLAIFATTTGHTFRLAALQGCKHIVCQLGINDLRIDTVTLATWQARALTAWTLLAGTGAKVWQTTLTPVAASSTDGYSTLGGQTTSTINPVRVNVNNWLLDGAPILTGTAVATGSNATGTLRAGAAGHPLTGYFEVADQLESARDSGLWKLDPMARTVTDAVMNSGSPNVSSATAAYINLDASVGGDKNKQMRVSGAGSAGAVLASGIGVYGNATLVALQANASTSVTGATALIYSPYTSDGIHPASPGHVVAATGIDPSVLGGNPTGPDGMPGLALWYKADAITGLADGATLTSWTDSRAGWPATAAQSYAGATSPVYKIGGPNLMPYVRFTRASTNSLASPNIAYPIGASMTTFLVAAVRGSSQQFLMNLTSAGAYRSFVSGYTAGVVQWYDGALKTCGAWTNAVWAIYEIVSDSVGNTSTLLANGTAGSSGTALTAAAASAQMFIGSGFAGGGESDADIAEVIHYSGALSSANRKIVRTYLGAKYAITVS